MEAIPVAVAASVLAVPIPVAAAGLALAVPRLAADYTVSAVAVQAAAMTAVVMAADFRVEQAFV